MQKILQGIDESLLDRFELKLVNGSLPNVVASGRINGTNDDFIFVDIKDDDLAWLKRYCGKQLFEIDFKINNVNYKAQHKALEYTEKYDLHSLLIANKEYNSKGDKNHPKDYNFWYGHA